MKPDQCGNGARGLLSPGDRAEIAAFAAWLSSGAVTHIRTVREIQAGRVPALQRQLVSGLPYHRGDLVKVTNETDPYCGRWGRVTDVIDYRHVHKVGAENTQLLDFLVMVEFYTLHRVDGFVPYSPGPIAFEPYELEAVFGAQGDWAKHGRVVSRRNWPASRSGESEAS